MSYSPLHISAFETGLVQSRQNFLLPNDAYPTIENAFIFRERIQRKSGCKLLGRLRRVLEDQSLGNTITTGVQFNLFTQINLTGAINNITQALPGSVTTTANHLLQTGQTVTLSGVGGMTEVNGNTYTITVTGVNTFTIGIDTSAFAPGVGGTWTVNDLSLNTDKQIEPGSVVITMPGAIVFTDQGNGTLTSITPGNSGVINYNTGNITLTTTAGAGTSIVSFNYFPNIPVMGLRQRELTDTNNEQLVAFDQTYAYIFTSGFEEFIPGTTWTGNDSDFFWSTNYWVGDANRKIFWVTNFSGVLGDPIRYTNGLAWVDFAPIVDAAGNRLQQCRAMLPFRGRMVTFNTFEGATLAGAVQYRQRIRWAAIGNPFTEVSSVVTVVSADAWRDDIRGKGGFLDIPTAEDIISVGFVRDNLVIFCESSTWQLRYTGRAIAPFQIEKVNTELGAESTFSAVQFDTSLVGVGDKGIVECDSYKSDRIDIKIPDQVFRFNNDNDGTKRVHGIRDYQQRVAYWTYPTADSSVTFPNRRLLYNYENDSWATFIDSYTTLGFHQSLQGRRWIDFPPTDDQNTWENANFPWQSEPAKFPAIVGGNQQGYVEILGQFGFQTQVGNDVSLTINGITGFTTTATSINSINHNLVTGQVIEIEDIPTGSGYASLNNGIFGVVVADADNFFLYKFDADSDEFDDPQVNPPATYIGGGQISIRDNINIVSKKFNFLDKGQSIQFGFMDILMNSTDAGAITMNVYMDYDDTQPINTLPQNVVVGSPNTPDTFFNTIIPTFSEVPNSSTKNWQRIYCNSRGAFITLQFTFSNAQMAGQEQENDVQIDSQILWIRPAGTQLARGA